MDQQHSPQTLAALDSHAIEPSSSASTPPLHTSTTTDRPSTTMSDTHKQVLHESSMELLKPPPPFSTTTVHHDQASPSKPCPTIHQAWKSSTAATPLRLVIIILTILSGIFAAIVPTAAEITLLTVGVLLLFHGALLLLDATATFRVVDRKRWPFCDIATHARPTVDTDISWVELPAQSATAARQDSSQLHIQYHKSKVRVHPVLAL